MNKTPEEALRHLELAYALQDIDTVLVHRDFGYEARKMLTEMPVLGATIDQDEKFPLLLEELAGVLKEAYINDMKQVGFPDLSDVTTEVERIAEISEREVHLREVCHDGHLTIHYHIVTIKDERGHWRVALVDEVAA